MTQKNTGWQNSSTWYNAHMKDEGSYNHRELILPQLLSMLKLNKNSHLLDLGCGEGILARSIDSNASYLGLDASSSLIRAAVQKDLNSLHHYKVADVMEPIKLKPIYTHATFVLSLQNMSHPDRALKNVSQALVPNGQLVIVINHPCFRIPKFSSWEFLEDHQGQYRRIDRYFSPFKSILKTHPSKQELSPTTSSYHWPLTDYISFLKEAHFVVDDLVEICSNKKSYGKAAKSENFARKEFPLFMMISARKLELKKSSH